MFWNEFIVWLMWGLWLFLKALNEHFSNKKGDKSSGYSSSSNTYRSKRSDPDSDDSKTGVTHVDYNPNSGVTFRENRNSDVKVVGRGYGEENSVNLETSNRPAAGNNRLAKERRSFRNRGKSYCIHFRYLYAIEHYWLFMLLYY